MRISDWSSDVCSSDLQTVQTSTFLVASPLAKEVQFKRNLPRHQDWDFVLRAERAGTHFVYAPECLALFRQTEPAGRISKQVNVAPSQYWLDRGGAELLSNEARNLFMATVIMPRLYPSRPRSEEHTSELQSLMRTS